MACYIASNDNRFYVALEDTYGQVRSISEADRCPGLGLAVRQQTLVPRRRDKTGTRTYHGTPGPLRRECAQAFRTYVVAGPAPGMAPPHGPLYQAGLGGVPRAFAGAPIASMAGNVIVCSAPHNLTMGTGVTCGGEIRFVAAIVDSHTVILNAPFTGGMTGGTSLGPTVTYVPGTRLPSVSLYDYWSPENAVHRIAAGAAVDKIRWQVNGDFHEVEFSGPAADVIDSASFASGEGGLATFPAEPTIGPTTDSPIPGFLGQIWIGSDPQRFFTVTEAEVVLQNHVDTRHREFGSLTPKCLVPGEREVTVGFRLYERDNEATAALYQAARHREPISFFLQMGEDPGRMCGIWISRFTPEVPEYEDDETRLKWRFRHGRAEGSADDDLFVSFG